MNLADKLTKPLPGPKLHECCLRILYWSFAKVLTHEWECFLGALYMFNSGHCYSLNEDWSEHEDRRFLPLTEWMFPPEYAEFLWILVWLTDKLSVTQWLTPWGDWFNLTVMETKWEMHAGVVWVDVGMMTSLAVTTKIMTSHANRPCTYHLEPMCSMTQISSRVF